jgi:hypothetical protein
LIYLPPEIGPIERLLSRYDAAVERRNQWRSLLQEAYRYAIPDRELFDHRTPGQRKGQELFDSTAIVGVHDFASRIQSSMCPAWRQWTKFVPGPGLPKELRENDELAMYLEEQTDIFFSYVDHSNFVLKTHEAFQDLSTGTGAITLELNERRNGFVFDTIAPPYLAIEEGPTGLIETVFMDRKMPPAHLERLYPGLVLPQKWQRMKVDKPAEKVEFQVGCVYEPTSGDYYLVVFSKGEKEVLYWDNYGESSPCIVFRWNAIPEETWGRGPVLTALPDIKTINKVVEFLLRGAALNLAPPFTVVNDGQVNPYTAIIAPNAMLPVSSNDQSNPSIRQLINEVKPDLAQLVINDLRESIRTHLFSDPRRKEGPIESATEVLIEDREFLHRIGSSFGRLQTEFAARVVARGVHLLRSIGKMANFRVDGREVTLKYTSPLARAQDQEELMALQTSAGLVAGIFGPETLHLAVKTEDVGEWILRKGGVDPSVLRTDAERKIMMEKAAQVAQQQLQQGAPQPARAA